MALWVAVHGFVDQVDKLNADTLNRPVRELTERTNYLYDNLQALVGAGVFESVVISSAPLATSDTPVAGDFVYLNESTGKYTKAVASVAADTLLSANSALSVGMVLSVSGTSGALVLYGKRTLTGVDFSSMLETDETFRNGPYYLSATTPGKMTANPSGIAIYLGYFIEDPANPGYGGSAVFNPQYKGTGEAHLHRTYMMYPQPAGTQTYTGVTPVDTHAVNGFVATTSPVGGDHVSRIVLYGTWAGTFDVQYTLWLSDSSSPSEAPSGTAPTDFSDCYLHWLSSDAEEGSGCVRLWAYDTPVAIGTKGIIAALENPDASNWDNPYDVTPDDPNKRTWVVQAPTQLVGWLARHYRLYFTGHPAVDNKFSFVLFNGPMVNADARTWDNVTVKCGKLYKAAYTATNPSDGETLTVGTTVFEFDNNATVTPGNIAVSLGSTAQESFENLTQAIVNQELTGVDAAHNQDDLHVMIAVPTATTVTTTVATVTLTNPYSLATGDLSTGTAGLLVYDQYHQVLVATTSYWGSATYWTPITLKNGLQLIAVPYSNSGVPATADTVAVGDYWDVDVEDEAPGANFVYSMGMHSNMNTYYPPLPLSAGVVILNGVELAPYELFPNSADYRLGMSSVYWYPDTYGNVPWSRDWTSVTSPGTYTMNLLLHFVNMAAGTTGLVTSLRPADGSPIKVLRCGTTEAATTGDLALDLDLNMTEVNEGLAGYQVVKGTNGQKLRKGPVVEKLMSTDGSVLITSTAGAPNGQGVIDLSVGSFRYEGDFEEVALQNAKQELMGMFPYIRLLGWTTGGSNIASAFVAKFRVPHNIGTSTTKYQVIVYMTVFGETTIPWVGGGSKQYAGLKFSYSILPDFNPATPDSSPAWNSLDRSLSPSEHLGIMSLGTPLQTNVPLGYYDAGDPSQPIYTAYDPMLVHNNPSEGPPADDDRKIAQIFGNPFPVASDLSYWDIAWGTPAVRPGSLVGIKVERADATLTPEYTGTLGFISIRWRLVLI